MTRKSGAVKRTDPEEGRSGDRFNVRVNSEVGQIIRTYCMHAHIPFNELAIHALLEYIDRHPRWPHDPVPLPRGPRLNPRVR